MMATAHLEHEARDGEGVARPPVARAGDADPLRSEALDHVDRTRGRDLRVRVERQPRPVAVVEDQRQRVLLGMIDHDALTLDVSETR